MTIDELSQLSAACYNNLDMFRHRQEKLQRQMVKFYENLVENGLPIDSANDSRLIYDNILKKTGLMADIKIAQHACKVLDEIIRCDWAKTFSTVEVEDCDIWNNRPVTHASSIIDGEDIILQTL